MSSKFYFVENNLIVALQENYSAFISVIYIKRMYPDQEAPANAGSSKGQCTLSYPCTKHPALVCNLYAEIISRNHTQSDCLIYHQRHKMIRLASRKN